MPKLNVTHLPERLQKRIEQLKNDEALEARDINALLNGKQQQALKDAWKAQQDLRAIHKPPKTEEKKKLLGWKTIKEVRIEIYEQALAQANDGLEEGYERKQEDAQVRRAKLYLDTYFSELDAGTEKSSAQLRANNELTRHKLQRLDGAVVGSMGLSKRDKEVRDMEDAILKRNEANLSAAEKEQLELSREYDEAVAKRKKQSK